MAKHVFLFRASAVLASLVLTLGLSLFMASGWAADEERGFLADLISRALSTPSSRVTIGKIEGALSSNATIHDIAIQDRDGTWLKLDRARIVWRRLALLQRRLEVDDFDIGQLTILRKPIPAEAPVAGEDQPLLPQLPVKVDIKQFALAELILGKPILGTPASFSMGGSVKLGAPSEGLDLHLDAQRLDHPASLTARMSLIPDTQALTLSVALNEPAGGLVSTLANIPGAPPVRLNIDGNGTLDAFSSKLVFDAGPDVSANGGATLHRDGTARRLGLELVAHIAGLVPGMVAPVFAETTKLTGNVVFGDDSSVSIPGIALEAAAARLNISGTVDPTQVADLTIDATNVPNNSAATAVGEAVIRKLAFAARLNGPLASLTIGSTLSLQDARLPAGSIERLEASFNTKPTGSLGETSTLLRFDAHAKAQGLDLTNPALAQAVGREASFETHGTSTLKGLITFDTLDLKAQTLAVHYAGQASGAELRGHMSAQAPDLSRFGAIAGLDLTGDASVSADIEGTPRSNRYNAKIDAQANHFATGVAPADGLFAGKVSLAGGVRLDADGGFGFEQLQLTGPHASAEINGAATPSLADVTALFHVPDLKRADARLSGRGELATHLTGTLDHPDAKATLSIQDATLLGRPVPHLSVETVATDLRGDPVASVSMDGEIDRKPAKGQLKLQRLADGATTLDGLDVTIGSVALQGALSLDAKTLADGHVTLRAGDLDDLSALALQKLGGGLNADIKASRDGGGQQATLQANGQHIQAAGVSLDRLTSDLTASDLYRHPVVNGQLAIDAAHVGGETISSIRLDAQGTPSASDVTLKAVARGLDIDARARVIPATPIRIELSKLEAKRGANHIGLVGTATASIADGGADLRSLVLDLSGGRLSIEGHAGSKLDLKANASRVSLSVANLIMPDLGLSGMLDGEAAVKGTSSALQGNYSLRFANVIAPQTKNAGLPLIDANASGRLDGMRTSVDATIRTGQDGTLTIKGSAPLSTSGALDLAVVGKLNAGLANRSIAAAGRNVSGAINIDGRVSGPVQHPKVNGSATLSGGTFTDAAMGVQLDAIRARAVARGDDISIESASAATKNGGTLGASGQIKIDPANGFPGTIKVTARHAQVMQSTLATAVVDLNLAIGGALARDPHLGGKVDIVSLDVPVPERLPGQLQPLAGTRHVRPTRTAAARLDIEAKKNRKGAPAFDMGLDLTVAVPGQIHVYGRGLDAKLGGGLHLTGTLSKPKPVGAFTLVRGRLQIMNTSLDFTRANLTFGGDLSPELDFLATTQAGGATIGISVTGQPSDPQFDFTSSPDLPRDEILSRLLFGAPSGQLSTTQALSLASAAAQYSTGGGGDALEGLRRSLGLGAASASSNPLTRALGDRVSVGVHTGATPADTGVGVDVSVYGPLKVKGAINANGSTSMGVGAEHEW